MKKFSPRVAAVLTTLVALMSTGLANKTVW